MKRPTTITTTLCSVTIICALALAATPMRAVEKGAERLTHLKTPAQAEALQPGDSIAMACSKCKSMTVERVTTEKGHIRLVTPGEKHLCPGCQSTITVVGTGKGAKDQVRHVCEKCGENSAYCCATTKSAGPTEGMQRQYQQKR